MEQKVGFLAFVFMSLLFIEINVSVKCDDPELKIVDFYSCDQLGFFRWCFEKNSTIYFNVTIRNLTSDPKNVSIYVVLYDNGSAPIGNQFFDITMPPNDSECYIVNFTIPKWAYVGTAEAYVSIWEEGVPIEEKATSFYISLECTCTNVTVHVQDLCGNPVFAQVSIWHESRIVARGDTDDPGNFNSSLLSGGYTTKAWNVNGWSSSTYSFTVPDNTYVIIILGARAGDVNWDGEVNVVDILVFKIAIDQGKTVQEFPSGDINCDGEVNVVDMLALKIILSGY